MRTALVSYEQFFLIVIISILFPVISLVSLIFFQLKETEVNLLEIQKNRILLEKELETSKYYQLSQQIQPHFLFNALNTLLSLLKLKKYDQLTEGFEHMVLFLKYKYKVHTNLYPLAEEVKYTNHFLQIQKIRFGQRLDIQFSIDEELEDELTIPFLLQTLVENAFKHGIEMTESRPCLAIQIEKEGSYGVMKVSDNGPGFSAGEHERQGTGLKNIRERLQLIYGAEATLTLANNEKEKGACVTVSWPLAFEK
ncbi:sensor histidine kinase [Planococcus sp. YIM B11945]|uniref:sensor histidine kinase n=1 Tax=Planococcus sp. YIM B11945 TaxID=3435410 RepID=UPI003D7D96B7